MKEESIEWLTYKKINQLSDAFIFSDKFTPFIQVEFSTPVSANILEKEKFTAGSTNDPDDFSLPDRTEKIAPEKLIRINSFNSSVDNSLSSYKYKSQTDIPSFFKEPEEETFEDYVTEEAKQLLLFLKNKPGILEKKVESSINFGYEEYTQSYFKINKRSNISQNIQSKSEENIYEKPVPPVKKEALKDKNPTQNINNYSSTSYENVEYNINNQETRIENSTGDIYYDLNNMSTSVHNDFITQNNTTNIINDMKTEVMQYINESVVNVQNNILQQTVNKQEIKQVKNEIIQVVENKIQQNQESIIQEIEKNTKKEISAFGKDFLNS